jgi:hypothetical protein
VRKGPRWGRVDPPADRATVRTSGGWTAPMMLMMWLSGTSGAVRRMIDRTWS